MNINIDDLPDDFAIPPTPEPEGYNDELEEEDEAMPEGPPATLSLPPLSSYSLDEPEQEEIDIGSLDLQLRFEDEGVETQSLDLGPMPNDDDDDDDEDLPTAIASYGPLAEPDPSARAASAAAPAAASAAAPAAVPERDVVDLTVEKKKTYRLKMLNEMDDYLAAPNALLGLPEILSRVYWAKKNPSKWILGANTTQPKTYKPSMEFTGKNDEWIWELKIDGHRARWDGINKVLVSRRGRWCYPPMEWSDCMPADVIIDGELEYEDHITHKKDLGQLAFVWGPNGNDSERARVRLNIKWLNVYFYAFDLPILGPPEEKEPPFLLMRKQILFWLLMNRPPISRCIRGGKVHDLLQIVPVNRFKVKHTPHQNITRAMAYQLHHNPDAEGIVIKNLYGAYSARRGITWFKSKFWSTTVALVIGTFTATGLTVQLPWKTPAGYEFAVQEMQHVNAEIRTAVLKTRNEDYRLSQQKALVIVRYQALTVNNCVTAATVLCLPSEGQTWDEEVSNHISYEV